MKDAPSLTILSGYKSSPKWTISSPTESMGHLIDAQNSLGPAGYNPVECVDHTSKFRRISSACKFSTSKRFHDSGGSITSIPGPGQYSPPPDYATSPYPSFGSISFGRGERHFPKHFHSMGRGKPGPNEYDIRGKYRKGGSTFDPKGVTVNHRHGWYYDADVKACRGNPAPGSYDPKYPSEKTDRMFSFGKGCRPTLIDSGSSNSPSPGQYDSKSTLGGSSFSFTHARSTVGSMYQSSDEQTVGPLCAQPTQFN
jgi:hypothetical protein